MTEFSLDLSAPVSEASAASPTHAGERVLLVWPHVGDDAACAAAGVMVAEGWSVLRVAVAPESDDAADAIVAAVQARARMSAAPVPSIIIMADRAVSVAACRAMVQLHRSDTLAACGLVTLDVFHELADDEPVCGALSALPGLASLWAVSAGATDARRSTLAYHRKLQAGARNTRFMVLPDAKSLAGELSDPRSAFGREVRWLLGPVNSRSN